MLQEKNNSRYCLFEKKNISFFLLIVFVFSYIVTLPFPGVIFFRQMFLALSLLLLFYLIFDRKLSLFTQGIGYPILLLGIFFLWVIIHAAFFSQEISIELKQLKGVWLRIFATCCLGILLGYFFRQSSFYGQRLFYASLLLSLVFVPVLIWIFNHKDLLDISSFFDWRYRSEPYGDKHTLVFYGGVLAALNFGCVSYLVRNRFELKKAIIPVLFIFFVLYTSFWVDTKNGVAICLVQILILGVFFVFKMAILKPKHYIYLGLFFLLVSAPVYKHINKNPSWANLIADAKVGFQIDKYDNWKRRTDGYPVNEYGIQASGTNYERSAWAAAGVQLIFENPKGYGVLKQSFQYLGSQRWKEFDPEAIRSTHSGWIDLGLAYGLPALLLIFLILFLSWHSALRANTLFGNAGVWVIPTIFLVWLFAEVCTGHFVEFLFFNLGIFSVINEPLKSKVE